MPSQALSIVDRALANEYNAAQDSSHPMRYELAKTSPRRSTTKKICETKDGDVARLIAQNGKPLSQTDQQKEEARLNGLLSDPGKQKRRKQSESEDMGRVLKVLRALPAAFVYQDAGPGEGPTGKPGDSPSAKIEKFTFKPNPGFSPPDLETQVLTQMAGEIWVDPVHLRVVRLEAHLQQDVDFGWGILGRLNKGGWIVIEQAEVGGGQWRTTHFQMAMRAGWCGRRACSTPRRMRRGTSRCQLGWGIRRRLNCCARINSVGDGLKPIKKRSRTECGTAFLLQRAFYIFTKTMTMVKRVRDSMNARPSTRKSMMAGRVPGLRATASAAEATARPWPMPHIPAARPIAMPAPIGIRLTAAVPPSAKTGTAKHSTARVMNTN
jgi:hypothetical protein